VVEGNANSLKKIVQRRQVKEKDREPARLISSSCFFSFFPLHASVFCIVRQRAYTFAVIIFWNNVVNNGT
jgi:hypothetical protein